MERALEQIPSSATISEFASRLPGKVYRPNDSEYETARKAWNLAVDQRPEIIVFPESAQDVVEAVSFARSSKLPIAVQCTGHGVKRAADGGMLINTSRLQELRINPESQTARLGAGVKWGPVLEQAQQHGLAPLLGSSPDVGAVGYTLGGGMGWLARKYGMSADSLLRLDVVTLDGVLRTVDAEHDAGLFWALRGGGGSFGVVTSMEIRLYPVTTVYAGNLYYPADRAREIFQRFREWSATAPDELTASIVLMNYPPFPELPPFLSGKSFVIVRGCYCGPIEEGERLMQSWRAWQTPVIDDFKTISFREAASISQDPVDPAPFAITGAWLNDLSDEAARTLIAHTLPHGGPPPLVFSEVRLAGGAIAKVDPNTNAYSHRDGRFAWMSVGIPMNPDMARVIKEHFERMHVALDKELSGRVYVNFVDGEEARQKTRASFGEANFRRLQAIKAEFDPEDRLRFALDIPPLQAS